MCGICGFNFSDRELIKRMCNKLAHRGPDADGYLLDYRVTLGHRRLSIIDLSKKGKNPIYNEDNSVCIIFNGEIYNFEELKRELEQKQHDFQTNTDTEVIVHGYEEYGVQCVEQLNGMFAFCMYDSKLKRLFLARDRLGKKPLYYYFNGKAFLFASEIKALLEYKEIKKEINLNALNNYFTFKYVPGPGTIFKNIYKLQPGHWMTFDLVMRELEIKKYWDANYTEQPNTEEFYLKQIRTLMEDSVKKRLISDVPLGVFLSGGLDSSAIVALMNKVSEETTKTFSVGFESNYRGINEHNELAYAEKVAERFQTDHTELICNFDNIRELLPKITYHLDEPMSDLASIPTYMIAQLARKKVTVALSGAGGDELFVGYRQALANHYYKYAQWIPQGIVRFLPATSKLRKAITTVHLPTAIERAANWATVFDSSLREQLLAPPVKIQIDYKHNNIFKVYEDNLKAYSPLNQNLYFELKTWLPDDLLNQIDKTTMMTSLEARCPFLDYRLVELMATVPSNLKIKGFQTKYLLKKAVSDILPREIIHRKKHGFTLPMTQWYRNELRDYTREILNNRELEKYINLDYINKILRRHQQGKEDFGFQLNNLISFGIWHKIYMEEIPPEKIV